MVKPRKNTRKQKTKSSPQLKQNELYHKGMMKLRLFGFRAHLDSEFEFKEGNLIMLKGPSGVGKSTILTAIFWVLYGGLNHIYNHNASTSKKCFVSLEMLERQPPLVVYRQKRPELFRVTLFPGTEKEQNYEDKVAQEYIDKEFGNRDVWQACSYIAQGCRSYFLSLNNNDKMTILNLLSFSTEDPDVYINRIEEELDKFNKDFSSKQSIYNKDCEVLKADLERAHLNMEEFIVPEERIQYQEALKQLEADKLRLMKEYATQQQILGKMNSLKDSQSKLTGALSSLANVILEEADLKNYEVQLDNFQKQKNIIPMASSVVKLENELKALDDQLQKMSAKLPTDADVETLVSDEQISSVMLSQKQYDENVNACKKLQLQYDSEVLTNEIQRLTAFLDSQPRIQTLNKLYAVYKQYLPFQQITGTISECDDAITLKREEIQRLSATLNVLKCPACTHPLRIMGNTLVKADCQPASAVEIEQAKRQLEELNLKKRRIQERDNLLREFKNMQSLAGSDVPTALVAELPSKDILAYKTRIAEISKIKILNAPTASATSLTQVANYQKLYLKKLSLEENLHKIRGTVPLEALELASLDLKTIDNKITEIKKKLSTSQEVKTRRKTLEQQLADAMAQLSNLSIDLTIKDRLDETIQSIDKVKQQLLASEKIDVFISRQNNLEHRHQEVF